MSNFKIPDKIQTRNRKRSATNSVMMSREENNNEKTTEQTVHTDLSSGVEDETIQQDQIDKPEDLILWIGPKARKSIVGNLMDFEQVLLDQDESEKKQWLEENRKLNGLLNHLSVGRNWTGDCDERPSKRKKSSEGVQSKRSNQLVFEITHAMRLSAIDTMMLNQCLMRGFYGEDVMIKNKLTEQSCDLIEKLTKLKSKRVEVEIEDEEFEEASNVTPETSVDQLANKIDCLKAQIVKLQGKFDARDLDKSRVEFKFELKHLTEFFEENSVSYSDLFYCHDVPFYLLIKVIEKHGTKNLGVYLQISNTQNKNYQTWFDLVLLRQRPDVANKIQRFTHTFTENQDTGFGTPKFLYQDELKRDAYIKDDKIEILVVLQVNSSEKN